MAEIDASKINELEKKTESRKLIFWESNQTFLSNVSPYFSV